MTKLHNNVMLMSKLNFFMTSMLGKAELEEGEAGEPHNMVNVRSGLVKENTETEVCKVKAQ